VDKNVFMHYTSIILNIFSFALLAYLHFTGIWSLLLWGKYEYGENAKWITVLIYNISYYWLAFGAVQILIATLVSIALRRRNCTKLSIYIQIFPFILLFFAAAVQEYLI